MEEKRFSEGQIWVHALDKGSPSCHFVGESLLGPTFGGPQPFKDEKSLDAGEEMVDSQKKEPGCIGARCNELSIEQEV